MDSRSWDPDDRSSALHPLHFGREEISEVCFNHDGSLIATGDLSGRIMVNYADSFDDDIYSLYFSRSGIFQYKHT